MTKGKKLNYANEELTLKILKNIDATKLENELGWKDDENFVSEIVKTVERYL